MLRWCSLFMWALSAAVISLKQTLWWRHVTSCVCVCVCCVWTGSDTLVILVNRIRITDEGFQKRLGLMSVSQVDAVWIGVVCWCVTHVVHCKSTFIVSFCKMLPYDFCSLHSAFIRPFADWDWNLKKASWDLRVSLIDVQYGVLTLTSDPWSRKYKSHEKFLLVFYSRFVLPVL